MALCAVARRVVLGLGLAAAGIGFVATPLATAQTVAAHDAKDIAGQWQGTLTLPKQSLRIVLVITKSDKGWNGKFYSIDQSGSGISADLTQDGKSLKAVVNVIGGSFDGTISPDGNTITGNWTQGDAVPLTLVRTTKETAWEIPAPPAPPKMMAADADPAFEVATIKPNDSGANNMQQLTINGRDFTVRAGSLADLLSFAYRVQVKQIQGLPDWATKDRYDIKATPDTEGAPSDMQVRNMIKKLLVERFQLKVRDDKKEMSAYVMTVVKPGVLKPTQFPGPLPGLGFRPAQGGLTLSARNAKTSDLAQLLQSLVLDRPVVDRTGTTARYDMTILFTPDDSLFGGHPPPLPAKQDNVETAPNFFEALQKDVGLKLEAQKTQVDVLVVDHVEKPSAN